MNFSLQLGPLSISLGKSLSAASAAWVRGDDVDANSGGALLRSPYQQSVWVYAAVNALADNVAGVPFRISRLSGGKARRVRSLMDSADPRHREECRRALNETIVESGDVVDLFERPHPTLNKSLFWEMVVSWEALRGEFFIVPLDLSDAPVDLTDRAPRVRRMMTLSPDMFRHQVVGNDLLEWHYTGSPMVSPLPTEILSPGEVVHSRTANPYDFWRGMSPITVAAVAAQTDFAASKFMSGLMMNNADTGIIVESDHPITKEQMDQVLAQLRERKRKAGTPDRPMALNGMKLSRPPISNADMEFLSNRKFSRQEIITGVFKVPESVLGLSESKAELGGGGGAGIQTEKLTFIENVITPKCRRIASALAPIVQSFGEDLIGWFDTDSLPVNQAARRARAETATKFFGMSVPFRDINQQFDLGFPDRPWYGKGLLPFSLQDASAVGVESLPSEDVTPPPAPSGDGEEEKPEDDEAEKSNPFARALKLLEAVKDKGPQVVCPHCGKGFDYDAQPEVCMGSVQCPHCGVVVSQSEDIPVTDLRSLVSHSIRASLISLWQKHVAARRKSVKLFATKTRRVLFEFRASTLAKLNEIHLEDFTPAAQRAPGETRAMVDLIFNASKFGEHLRVALNGPIRATLDLAANELLEEIGATDPWSVPPKEVTDFIARRDQPIMGTGQTVRSQLNTALEEGLKNGESTTQLADRIRATFNRLAGGDEMGTSEALRVAQTEVNVAFNHSRTLAMDHAGIEFKAWLSSHGPNVRETHEEAEDRYIDNPIPIGEPFEVGGYLMMYPGDDSMGAPLKEIINCHCIQLAAEKEGEDEKSVRYLIHGIGKMEFKKL